MIKNNYDKKFSIAHWDGCHDDNFFLKSFENASEQWRNEIYDIYFGATFRYDDVVYGDVMGVNASPAHYKNLLKIQEKYGIPISLTLNSMNMPIDMIRHDVVECFLRYIKKYYDDGVRICTISHTHLMRLGALQDAFPDMDWKNTVNHGISSTQEMIDFAALGYTTIQLDRDFNRNLNELKRAKKEADRLGIKTCLLIRESCMPQCPFKAEHDHWQPGKALKEIGKSYWEVVPFTCNTWRTANFSSGTQQEIDSGVVNPRTATNIMVHSKDDWDEFASLVDIFKTSGRLNRFSDTEEPDFGYYYQMWKDPKKQMNHPPPQTYMFKASCFKDIYENNLAPIHMWFISIAHKKGYPLITDIDEIKKITANNFWNSEEAVDLQNTLKRCKNQCYSCHKCDDLFQTGNMESVLNIPITHPNRDIVKSHSIQDVY